MGNTSMTNVERSPELVEGAHIDTAQGTLRLLSRQLEGDFHAKKREGPWAKQLFDTLNGFADEFPSLELNDIQKTLISNMTGEIYERIVKEFQALSARGLSPWRNIEDLRLEYDMDMALMQIYTFLASLEVKKVARIAD